MVEVKGGEALEAALQKIAAAASGAATVDVGFMGSATEADGTPVPLVAALNEYGVPSRGQPPRPFMRQTIEKNSPKWPINLGTALKNNDWNAATALGLIGLEIKDEIQASIRELVSPPLAPSTVAAKGFDKPLISTSTMLNSVTLKVNSK